MTVGRWYPSKIDTWLAVILAIAPVICIVSVIAVHGSERLIAIAGAAFLGLICVGLVFPMRYAISDEHVIVRHGLVRQRIPLREITEVRPTNNPLSSPALSLDRLNIKFGEGFTKSAMISPAAKAEFLDELATKAGLRRDGAGLVR